MQLMPDGERKPVPIWWDTKLEAFACPVRDITPEVEEYEWWFEQTHEISAVGMSTLLVCRCVRLPEAGSVGEQEARLWQALTVLAATTNELLAEQAKKRS